MQSRGVVLQNKALALALIALGLLCFSPFAADAATLSFSPGSGTFLTDSTFTVSVYLDTQGQTINAVDLDLRFPPNKLQIISPSVGKSVIGIWTVQPYADNEAGIYRLQGGIAHGINTTNGLITTITFRVKSAGDAVLKFADSSRLLLNDGNGTDALTDTVNGLYRFQLPPPAGPYVVSQTHPDQTRWYRSGNVTLSWTPEMGGITGYSYSLSDTPGDEPDNISEGAGVSVLYNNVSPGIHYFHIKAQQGSLWGGVTHFALDIDSEPPAEFTPQIAPSVRTTSRNLLVNFLTTDRHSGIDHYEYQLIPISLTPEANAAQKQLFVETSSPLALYDLQYGTYDLIIRAYDQAGNNRDETARIKIIKPILFFLTPDGLNFGQAVVSWGWVLGALLLLIIFLILVRMRARRWHHAMLEKNEGGAMPEDVSKRLEELNEYRKRFGQLAIIFALASLALIYGVSGRHAKAADTALISPPYVSAVAEHLTNEDIFYIGGNTTLAEEEVIVYLQNLQTGEIFSESTTADNKGNWLYRSPTFLSAGRYIVWTQAKVGDIVSPPSPQINFTVAQTAIQFGASRLSYEIIYLFLALLFFMGNIILVIFILYHFYHGRKNYKAHREKARRAEESIKRGFAVLRRDIEAELAIIHAAQLEGVISEEEKQREAKLISDLREVEKNVDREIWELESSHPHPPPSS